MKPKNREKIEAAIEDKSLKVIFNSTLASIHDDYVMLKTETAADPEKIPNDLVYIFAGGELPTGFLQKSGVNISKRFGYVMKRHE